MGRAAPAAGVYDMAGNVWEWEDGCETGVDGGAAGSDDRCRTRGGAVDGSETATRCDFDTFTKRSPTRGSKSADTGLRCCSR